MEIIPTVFMNDPVFRKLRDVAKVAVLDKKERREYERSLKIYRDNYAIFKTERSQGFAEGRAEGLAEGEVKGRAEGRAEVETEIVRRMLSRGLSIQEVAEITGFTIDAIKGMIHK